jgi:DNA-directed RNA polymerase subunit omega
VARLTSELAVEKIGNRFNLILIASLRSRELKRGHQPLIQSKSGPNITALREIEAGKIGVEYLQKIRKKKKNSYDRDED